MLTQQSSHAHRFDVRAIGHCGRQEEEEEEEEEEETDIKKEQKRNIWTSDIGAVGNFSGLGPYLAASLRSIFKIDGLRTRFLP